MLADRGNDVSCRRFPESAGTGRRIPHDGSGRKKNAARNEPEPRFW